MEIFGICFLIILGILIEHQIYLTKVFPYIGYECKFSVDEVFEGADIEIIETVTNPTALPISSLKSEISTSKYLDFAGNTSAVNDKTRSLASLFSIAGKKRVTRAWKAKCLKRGIYHIEDTTIVANDIFGFCKYSSLFFVKGSLVVLPTPVLLDIAPIGYKELQGDQVVRRFILEDPFTVSGVREYTQRDTMNQIHWGMSARHNQLMVRHHEATTQQNMTVIINMQLNKAQLREEMTDDKLELAIQIAAGELEYTLPRSIPIKLMANAATLDAQTSLVSKEMWGYTHIHDLFVSLAGLQTTFTLHFSQFLKEYDSEITSPYVTLITAFMDEEIAAFIREKERFGIHFKVYFLSFSKDAVHFPDLEIYYVLDHTTRKKVS